MGPSLGFLRETRVFVVAFMVFKVAHPGPKVNPSGEIFSPMGCHNALPPYFYKR